MVQPPEMHSSAPSVDKRNQDRGMGFMVEPTLAMHGIVVCRWPHSF